MKKSLILVVGLLALTSLAGALDVVKSPRWSFLIPASIADNVHDVMRRWSPPSIASVGQAATGCYLMHTGKGIVVGVQGTGDASAGVRLYDSTVIASHSYATVDTTRLIGSYSVDTSKVPGQYELGDGAPFSNGLVACWKDASVSASIRFRKQTQ